MLLRFLDAFLKENYQALYTQTNISELIIGLILF